MPKVTVPEQLFSVINFKLIKIGWNYRNDAMVDFKDASESSCTLVDELTPVNSKPGSSPVTNGIRCWRGEKVLEDELRDENVFLPSSFNKVEDSEDMDELVMESGIAVGDVFICSNSCSLSGRQNRLHAVRKHFYSLYSSAIGFQSRHNVNDSSSGLSILIGNIATKVGIRAPTRNTS